MQEKNFDKRLALLPVAALFLANPHVSAIDILPDLVGILMLLYIFSPLAHSSLHMRDTLRCLRRSALYTLLRLPATALLIFLFVRYPTQNTLFPLFSLSFLILDCIVILPAFLHFCRALADYDEEHALFDCGFTSVLASFARRAPVFFVLRGFFPFLADLLLTTDDGATTSLAAFYPIAAILALLPSLILAYLFYTSLCALKPFLQKATASLEKLVLPYKELAERETRVSAIRYGWIAILLYALCAADLYFGGVDYAPDVLAPLFVLLALYFFERSGTLRRSQTKKSVLYALVLCVPSLAADISHALFFRTYDWRDIYYSAKAESFYIAVLVIFFIKLVCDLLLLLALYRPLLHMATEETGSYVENSPIRRQEEKNRRSLARIVLVFCIWGVVGALLEFGNMLCSLFPVAYAADKNHVAGGAVLLPALDFLPVLVTALMLLRFGYMIFSYWRILEETRIKYKLDETEN